jgi:hypothetical protein
MSMQSVHNRGTLIYQIFTHLLPMMMMIMGVMLFLLFVIMRVMFMPVIRSTFL